jgi:hypothetical protein
MGGQMPAEIDPVHREQLGLLSTAAPDVFGKMLQQQMVPSTPDPTTAQREYALAKAQGFKGSFMDYLTTVKKAGATSVTVGDVKPPYNIPSNYMLRDPNDPSKGVVPIPGGPGEKRSGEVAGKEAMISTARAYLPVITDILFEGGDPAGGKINKDALWEKAGAKYLPGSMLPSGSKLGNALEIGIQAITRLETGAAMPPEEVENTRTRFEPSPLDSDDVIRQKYYAYQLFLENASKYLDPNAASTGNWAVDVDKALKDAKKELGKNQKNGPVDVRVEADRILGL